MNEQGGKKPADEFFDNFKKFMKYDRDGKRNVPVSEIAQDILSRSMRDKRLENNGYNNDINKPLEKQDKPVEQSSEPSGGQDSGHIKESSGDTFLIILGSVFGILLLINIGLTIFNLYRVWQYEKALVYQDNQIEEGFTPYTPPLTVGEKNAFKNLVRISASDIAKRHGLRVQETLEKYRDEVWKRLHEKLQDDWTFERKFS